MNEPYDTETNSPELDPKERRIRTKVFYNIDGAALASEINEFIAGRVACMTVWYEDSRIAFVAVDLMDTCDSEPPRIIRMLGETVEVKR